MYSMESTKDSPRRQGNELPQVERRINQLLAAEKLTGTRYYNDDIKRLMARRKELRQSAEKGAR